MKNYTVYWSHNNSIALHPYHAGDDFETEALIALNGSIVNVPLKFWLYENNELEHTLKATYVNGMKKVYD